MVDVRLLTRRLRSRPVLEDLAVEAVYGTARILAALPGRWVLRLGDTLGHLLALLDRRGREVAFQNMAIAFGDGLPRAERRRIHRASCRHVMRSMLLLLHLQPMTAARFCKWVDPPGDDFIPVRDRIRNTGAVLVSGHVGNWELLLGVRTLFRDFPPSVFLAEQIPHRAVNRLLERLRSHADLRSALRKGGARALMSVLGKGGTVGIHVDRNVRRQHGGIWIPFFGLPARTTPLPAWLATRYRVPLHPIFCLPTEGGRYRLWIGPDLTENLTSTDEIETNREIMGRVNGVVEDLIRARPELWTWSLKRFKSRPDQELGPYPPYSEWDWNHGPLRH
jgi:KDO2-lipid IV(A) lauroyltransferase